MSRLLGETSKNGNRPLLIQCGRAMLSANGSDVSPE